MCGEGKQGMGAYVRQFFTNWREYDASFGKKALLTVKNRTRSVATFKGCCGHHGEPGC
jgi:hypothetical protein